MGLSIVTMTQAKAGATPLEAIGPVADLTYSHSWPGGCLTAQWSLGVPARFAHPALQPGRLVVIYDGPSITWAGVLREPERGDPWTFTADGLQSMCANYVALSPNANTAVDGAISRGLPVYRDVTLPTPTLQPGAATTIADLLNQVALSQGSRWGVDHHRRIVMQPDPATAKYLLNMTDTFGRVLDGYATNVYVRYYDSSTTPPTETDVAGTAAATATTPFGRIEAVQDITGDGPMTQAEAQQRVAGIATLIGQRLSFTGTLTIQPGQLLNAGGVPVRLATVRAGQAVQLLGVQPDTALGEVNYTGGVIVTLGQTTYHSSAGTLDIQPVQTVRSDLQSVMTAAFS